MILLTSQCGGPLIVADVFCTPLFTVNCRFSGALRVTMTLPGAEQVASPVEPIVAAAMPVLVGEVFHESPSTFDVPDSYRSRTFGFGIANLALRMLVVVAD